jgi:hypothetical protein
VSKHTPGPWRVGGGDRVFAWVVADHPVPEMPGSGDEFYGGHMVAESITQENAKLIAAAPELLALLIELIDIEGPQPGTGMWANKVEAAIKKATS